MTLSRSRYTFGFTLIELLISISIIAILAGLVVVNVYAGQDKARLAKATAEMSVIGNSAKLYVLKSNVYPADVTDGIPPEFLEYVKSTDSNSAWPNAPWPQSLYDYEAWDITGDGVVDTYQISVRFCSWNEAGGPEGARLCASRAPKHLDWAKDFKSNNNSVYYCLKGYCRANCSDSRLPGTNCNVPVNTPGYCVDCANNQAVKYPGET